MPTTTTLMPEGRQRYYNNDGTPAAGGKLYTYAAGTSAPKATFADADGTAPNPNPVPLDAKGEAVIYWNGAYKVDLKQADGLQVTGYPVDNLRTDPAGVWTLLSQLAAAAGSALMGFIAAGSALKRTVEDKLRETVTVSDYGTVSDGAADASPAAQKALNTGKNVRFTGPGTYLLGAPLIGKSNQTVTIEAGATVKVGVAMRAAFNFVDRSNAAVRGKGVLDCNALATSGVLFQSDQVGASDLRVEGVTIQNTKPDPTLQFGGVEISSTGGAGGTRSKRASIKGVTLLNTGTHGAIAAYTDGVRFQGNLVDGAANHGFEAVSCSNVVESGNDVKNCLISGLGVGTHTTNWTISNNVITNCGGDGAITAEHNSNFGVISNNVIRDANGSSGINVSFGTPIAAPFERVQNIKVVGNVIACKAGLLNRYGVNFYSSTGAGLGKGVTIEDNTIDGFNVGIAYQYADSGSVKGNTVRNLVGANSMMFLGQLLTRTHITANLCDSDTGDHAIKLLDYAGQTSDKCSVSGNTVVASGTGAKALVYIEGTGIHNVSNNFTGGSTHYVECPGTAAVLMSGNNGNLANTPYLGANVTAVSNGNNSQDVALVGGRKIAMNNAPPTTGTWQRGDRCLNIDPQVGSPKGWTCTVGGVGAGATWVSDGPL